MTIENKLIEMMREMPEADTATESEWRRFSSRAHRSMWGRRAAIVGAAGMTAFVGTYYVDDLPSGPSTLRPASEQTAENDVATDDLGAAEPRMGKREPLILAMRSEGGDPAHVLRPSTVVFGRADLDGGRLFYKVIGPEGDVLARGKIDPEPCANDDDCDRQYRTTIPFEVEREQPGRLVVYIEDSNGRETASVRTKIVLTPEE